MSAFMPGVRFELSTTVFERTRAVHDLDREATLTGEFLYMYPKIITHGAPYPWCAGNFSDTSSVRAVYIAGDYLQFVASVIVSNCEYREGIGLEN
jgi:hypothetical protein